MKVVFHQRNDGLWAVCKSFFGDGIQARRLSKNSDDIFRLASILRFRQHAHDFQADVMTHGEPARIETVDLFSIPQHLRDEEMDKEKSIILRVFCETPLDFITFVGYSLALLKYGTAKRYPNPFIGKATRPTSKKAVKLSWDY